MEYYRFREKLAVPALVVGLLGTTACSGELGEPGLLEETTSSSTTTTSAIEKEVITQEEAIDAVEEEIAEDLQDVFRRVYSGNVEAESIEVQSEDYGQLRLYEVTMTRDGKQLMIMAEAPSTQENPEYENANFVLAQLTVPGYLLNEDERLSNASTDNPEGNRMIAEVYFSDSVIDNPSIPLAIGGVNTELMPFSNSEGVVSDEFESDIKPGVESALEAQETLAEIHSWLSGAQTD